MQVVIVTDDAHAANVFVAFLKTFELHWPDCPWPVVALGETVSVSAFPTVLQGLTPPGRTRRDRLRAYLTASYGDETVMALQDDFVFYAHTVNTPVLTRAHKTLLADDSVGAVFLANNQAREPEKFYDGHLGEFDGPRGLSHWDAAIWRVPAYIEQLKRQAWPRVLGTYHPPMVYADLVIGERLLCGAVVVGLIRHHSPALPYADALVEAGFKIHELEQIKKENRPNMREAMIMLIERYGYKL